MTATIYRFPQTKGYSLWGSCDMDGKAIWFVDYADSDGVVHDQWQFNDRLAALAFLRTKAEERW
jgi:hypothetical protein